MLCLMLFTGVNANTFGVPKRRRIKRGKNIFLEEGGEKEEKFIMIL